MADEPKVTPTRILAYEDQTLVPMGWPELQGISAVKWLAFFLAMEDLADGGVS